MYCIAAIFSAQQLKFMGVLAHPNLNQLDLNGKVILGCAGTKDSCSVPEHKTEAVVPQPNPLERLTSVVEDM